MGFSIPPVSFAGQSPQAVRKEFDNGAGTEPMLQASAAYNQFAQHIQNLAEKTQSIVQHLQWEALASERAQEAAAAFSNAMQQYAEYAQYAAAIAQSQAQANTQAGQQQMSQQMLSMIMMMMMMAMMQQNPGQMQQANMMQMMAMMMMMMAMSQLGQAAQTGASSLPALSQMPQLANPDSSQSSGSDPLSALASILPAVAAPLAMAPALLANREPPPPPPPPGVPGGGSDGMGDGTFLAAPPFLGLPPGAGLFIPGPGGPPRLPGFVPGGRAVPISGMMPAGAGAGAGARNRNKDAQATADDVDQPLPFGILGNEFADDGTYLDVRKLTAEKWVTADPPSRA